MHDTAIERVTAWEALDSRGTPTLGCMVRLAGGAIGQATVPSGASTGSHDAIERRDDDGDWDGLGVTGSVDALRTTVSEALRGADVADVDERLGQLDPSPQLEQLGVHAALGVSVAAHRAQAMGAGQPLHALLSGGTRPHLPLPMVNVVSGGAHAGGAVDIQDVLVVPVGASSLREALLWSWRVRRAAAQVAADRGMPATLVADEGGLGLPLASNAAALELVTTAIERAELEPGEQAALAIDVAANQLWDGRAYRLASEDRELDADGLIAEVAGWARRFPLVSVEDVLHDADWEGWRAASDALGGIQVLGDDLFATAITRVRDASARGVANAVLIKPNQRGTLSSAATTVAGSRDLGYATVVSARSGDTEDDWLADLAVGWGAGQIKVGSTTRSERTAKWNRLLQIEAEAEGSATFAGAAALAR